MVQFKAVEEGGKWFVYRDGERFAENPGPFTQHEAEQVARDAQEAEEDAAYNRLIQNHAAQRASRGID